MISERQLCKVLGYYTQCASTTLHADEIKLACHIFEVSCKLIHTCIHVSAVSNATCNTTQK